MISICLAYLIFTFREFKSIHKGKTAILHLRFGTEKNRRLGSKKARYNRAFRKRHLFCLHIMARREGFEPATFWFVAKHSIRLSYRRICNFYCSSILTLLEQKVNIFLRSVRINRFLLYSEATEISPYK